MLSVWESLFNKEVPFIYMNHDNLVTLLRDWSRSMWKFVCEPILKSINVKNICLTTMNLENAYLEHINIEKLFFP